MTKAELDEARDYALGRMCNAQQRLDDARLAMDDAIQTFNKAGRDFESARMDFRRLCDKRVGDVQ